MNALRGVLVAALVAVALVPLRPAPASAAPGTATFVTAVTDKNDSVGRGAARLWRDDEVSVSGNLDDGITVHADSGGDDGWSLALGFSAASGDQLDVGHYEDTHVPGTSEDINHPDGGPDLDVRGHISAASANTSCEGSTGSFTVHDLAPDLSRLWISYVQYCGGQDAPLFGEIRYQEPQDGSGLVIAPSHVEWPPSYRGITAHPVPVTLVNAGATPVEVRSASIEGSSAYRIADTDCDTISPRGTCTVDVTYTPPTFAATEARLVIDDSTPQATHEVGLSGSVIPGYTSWQMHSQDGDWIGQGGDFAYTPANARITGSGYSFSISVYVDVAFGTWWDARFSLPPGETLRAGTTYVAPRGHHGGSPAIEVDGTGRGCGADEWGSFTVHEVSYDEYHYMKTFSATFTQYCEATAGEAPLGALTGSVAWHSPTPARATPSAPKLTARVSLTQRAPVFDGDRTVLSGRLSWGSGDTGASDKPLVAYARPHEGGIWHAVGSTRTGRYGDFTLSTVTRRSTDYLVRYAGDRDFHPSSSRVMTVPARWRVHLSRAYAVGHHKARLYLSVLGGPKGQFVVLQHRTSSGWQREIRKRLSARGTAAFTLRLPKRGGLDRRVLVPAGDGHLGAVSEVQNVPYRGP